MQKNTLWFFGSKQLGLLAFALISASWVQAQTIISNSVTVLGYVDVTNDISYGTLSNGTPAIYLQNTNGNNEFTAGQTSSVFLWQDGGTNTPNNKMRLDGGNNLTLFGTNGVSSGITFNPSQGGGITFSNSGAGVTFADGTSIRSAGAGVVTIGTNGSISSGYSVLTSATGQYSISIGVVDTASGNFSAAFGLADTASGSNSTVFGIGNSASGYGSLADGSSNTASATASTAFGVGTKASSFASLALGYYNVGLVSPNNGATSWVPTDPILEIGNGTNSVTTTNYGLYVTTTQIPSDALTIFKNGNLRTVGTVEAQNGVRIPATGDISMGSYTNGNSPTNFQATNGLTYPGGN